MTDDFSLCMLANARKAARAVSRRYDGYVRSFGLKAAQFSVLAAVRAGPGKVTSELATGISMERTTLVRNLALLERKGLVKGLPAPSGNGRTFVLTEEGEALMDKALPAWRKAQAELAAELGIADWDKAQEALRKLSQV